MINRGGGLGFAPEAPLGLGVLGQPRGEKLQGDGSVEVGVEGFVNHAHPAFPKFFEQTVVRDDVFGGGSLGKPDDFARSVDLFDRAAESVAPAREGFDKTPLVGGIIQSLPQFTDGDIEAFFEINESAVGPKPFAKGVPGDEFAGAFEQRGEHLKRLLLQANLHPTLAKLAGLEIQLEGFKPRHPRNVERLLHRNAAVSPRSVRDLQLAVGIGGNYSAFGGADDSPLVSRSRQLARDQP